MPLVAEPWVKPDDYGLRADIQRLADAGVINSPVTTYPLMWKSFIGEVRSMPLEKLSPSLQDAILRVKNRYSSENNSAHNFHVDAYVSSDTRTVTSFGAANTQETELLTSYSYMGENFAAKVAVNHRDNGKKCYVTGKTQTDIASNEQALEDCDDTSFDHSYIAYRLGNWILRAGAIEQFWGPGVDNSLIMSTNAKPLPALSITREQSSAFETPWLSWIGQWSFTSQMAELESNRAIPDALLWSSRLNFRPLQQLEVAFSWSAQWAGEGQASSGKDFFEMITGGTYCINGEENCDSQLESKLGNQLAGIDLRWSDTLFEQPYAFYISAIGEDASSYFKPADRAYLAGIETTARLFDQNLMFNLEYIDTGVSCTAGLENQNCYYEHSDYNSGYRYHGKTIGSAYDNDSQSLVFTTLGQLSNGDDWQVKLRQVDYNNDNADSYPSNPDLGNTITKQALDSKQLELRYRMLAFNGRLSLGALTAKNKATNESNTDTSGFLKYEYNF